MPTGFHLWNELSRKGVRVFSLLQENHHVAREIVKYFALTDMQY